VFRRMVNTGLGEKGLRVFIPGENRKLFAEWFTFDIEESVDMSGPTKEGNRDGSFSIVTKRTFGIFLG